MRKKVRNERSAREKLGMILDMPLDMINGCSRMTVIGNESILLENYKGIVEYEENIIRIEADEVQKIATKINKIVKAKKLDVPILAVPMNIRHMCFIILSEFVPNIRVIACEELTSNFDIKFVDKV